MKIPTDYSLICSKIKRFLTSTIFLTYWIVVFGAFLFFAGAGIGNALFHGNVPEVYYNILFSITLLFLITASVFIIIRKEIARPYGRSSITGWFPVIVGVVMLIVLAYGEINFVIQIIHYFSG